jgi:phosphoribosylamine---glycine ligase
MKVLVVGGGGREHAIVWKIAQSENLSSIYCAPGNGGISKIAKCVDIKATDIEGIVKFSKENGIDLVIVGPDDPLAMGMVDALEKEGIRAFGPTAKAAEIEASKAFSKDLMKKYNIPTAKYEVFEDTSKALEYLGSVTYPTVVKADGLALGKGVIIANNYDEAKEAVISMLEGDKFGSAGKKVVVEEFLIGQEVSILAFSDGKTIVPMVSSQDHKRAYDNDMGSNTGGMGTFSPSRIYDEKLAQRCMNEIFKPTIAAMAKEGRKFKGILFTGLIITQDGPKVLEYNARFGDPETQVVLPRLKSDFLNIINAAVDEKLAETEIEWDDKAAVCVVMASGGYPDTYETGILIEGINEASDDSNVVVFHAGTKCTECDFYTSGGRVLGVTALEDSLDAAVKKSYEAVAKISFKNAHYRKDIGRKGE